MTVSVGLVGRGDIARAHLRGYRFTPDEAIATATATVVADADRTRDGPRPAHPHEEGTDVLKNILAAHRSAHERREIGL